MIRKRHQPMTPKRFAKKVYDEYSRLFMAEIKAAEEDRDKGFYELLKEAEERRRNSEVVE
jgi:hypothetical protein